MLFVVIGGYRPVRSVSGQSGVPLRFAKMRVAVRQCLAGYSEGGDQDEDRRKKAVRGTAVHVPKLRSGCIGC